MLVINLFGSPGAWKSTGAAYIFSRLKLKNVNAELITEFAKDKVWEENYTALSNQAYVFGQQYYKMSKVDGKVDVIVTDSPLLLSSFYNKNRLLGAEFDQLVMNVFKSFNSLNFFITREKPYNPKGRLHTEEESAGISEDILQVLRLNRISFMEIPGNIEGYDLIVDTILPLYKGAPNWLKSNPVQTLTPELVTSQK